MKRCAFGMKILYVWQTMIDDTPQPPVRLATKTRKLSGYGIVFRHNSISVPVLQDTVERKRSQGRS